MMMTVLTALLLTAAVAAAAVTGQGDRLAPAILGGAEQSVSLALMLAGMLPLWAGVLEVLRRAGAVSGLAQMLRPLLGRLYPQVRDNAAVMEDISANVSANLLGLGSAATPAGIRAARGMSRGDGTATDAMCMLIVCNTASIQLIPASVAAVRAGCGCLTPFDILPAVWLSSAVSVTVGILAAKGFARLWRKIWS